MFILYRFTGKIEQVEEKDEQNRGSKEKVKDDLGSREKNNCMVNRREREKESGKAARRKHVVGKKKQVMQQEVN